MLSVYKCLTHCSSPVRRCNYAHLLDEKIEPQEGSPDPSSQLEWLQCGFNPGL